MCHRVNLSINNLPLRKNLDAVLETADSLLYVSLLSALVEVMAALRDQRIMELGGVCILCLHLTQEMTQYPRVKEGVKSHTAS